MKSELVFPGGTGVRIEGVHCHFQQRTRLVYTKKTLRVYRDTATLNRKSFAVLYALYGAWIESENPALVRKALGLNPGDPRVRSWGCPSRMPTKLSLVLVR